MKDITRNCRDQLLNSLSDVLDTRDKRFMFLKLEFNRLVSRIDLEGSADNASFAIYDEFQKLGLLKELIEVLNSKLNTQIIYEANN